MTLQIFLNIFNQKKETLLSKDDEPSCLMNLSNKRTWFLAQINSASLPQQKAALNKLINVRCKIQSLRKAEKTRKHCWLVKRAENEFNVNP